MKRFLSILFIFYLILGFSAAAILRKTAKKSNQQFNEIKNFELYADNSVKHQSSANYGKYLFLVTNKLASITLYDLDKKQPIYTLQLPPHNETANKEGILSIVLYHCNQSSFGIERYNKKDKFPLLYISQRNMSNTKRALNTVYRIIPNWNKQGDISSFKAVQVQTIYFPQMTETNCMGTPNVAIDAETGYMYAYCRNNNSKDANYLKAVVAKFKLPALRDKDGKVRTQVILNDKDIIDSFHMDWNILAAQGGFIKNGQLILCQGAPGKKNPKRPVYLRTIDLNQKKQILAVNLVPLGFAYEPEGVFFYKGHAMTSINGKYIFKFNFK